MSKVITEQFVHDESSVQSIVWLAYVKTFIIFGSTSVDSHTFSGLSKRNMKISVLCLSAGHTVLHARFPSTITTQLPTSLSQHSYQQSAALWRGSTPAL